MSEAEKIDYQGGKAYGEMKQKWDEEFQLANQQFLESDDYEDVEDLPGKLEEFKENFLEYDQDGDGVLGMMDVKYVMEKLGQAKTHLEIKKIIAEVDETDKGAISYSEFLLMLLGKRNSILKLILMFEQKKNEAAKPVGPPPKKTLADLGVNTGGGKTFGSMPKQKRDEKFQLVNQQFLESDDYEDVEDLPGKLEEFKENFLEYDQDGDGELGIMDLKYVMEKLGQAKTHLELKKMIAEVDQTNKGTISYSEFLLMLLGKPNTILKLILMFEQKKNEAAKSVGPPPI